MKKNLLYSENKIYTNKIWYSWKIIKKLKNCVCHVSQELQGAIGAHQANMDGRKA